MQCRIRTCLCLSGVRTSAMRTPVSTVAVEGAAAPAGTLHSRWIAHRLLTAASDMRSLWRCRRPSRWSAVFHRAVICAGDDRSVSVPGDIFRRYFNATGVSNRDGHSLPRGSGVGPGARNGTEARAARLPTFCRTIPPSVRPRALASAVYDLLSYRSEGGPALAVRSSPPAITTSTTCSKPNKTLSISWKIRSVTFRPTADGVP